MKITITSDEGEIYEVLTSPPGEPWTDSLGEVICDDDQAFVGWGIFDNSIHGTFLSDILASARKWEKANA